MGYHYALRIQTVEQRMDAVLTTERVIVILAMVFSGLALVLAAIGLYGLSSFDVTRRTAEIGLRMSLGAQRHQIVGLMLTDMVPPGTRWHLVWNRRSHGGFSILYCTSIRNSFDRYLYPALLRCHDHFVVLRWSINAGIPSFHYRADERPAPVGA